MNYIFTIILFTSQFALCFQTKGNITQSNNKFDTVMLKQIAIEGGTNLNSFTFEYTNCSNNPTKLNLSKEKSILYNFNIPVSGFKTFNEKMQVDFNKMLKADDYPYVSVSIEESSIFETLNEKRGKNFTDAELELAGIKKETNITYTVSRTSNKQYILKGFTKISLKEFSLKSPEYMFGLIKLRDSIFIKFELFLFINK